MSEIILKNLNTDSFESFKQRLKTMSSKNLTYIMTNPLSLKEDNDYRMLAQLSLVKGNCIDSNMKFEYVLELLSHVEGFDLPHYLNSYHVSNSDLYKGSSLYFHNCFTKDIPKMQLLCRYGYNPNTKIIGDSGDEITPDHIMRSCADKGEHDKEYFKVIATHKALVKLYLKKNLEESLWIKPENQNKIKI